MPKPFQQVGLIGKIYSFVLPRSKDNPGYCITLKSHVKFVEKVSALKGFMEYDLIVSGEYIFVFNHVWDDITLANKLISIANKIGWKEGEWE